MGIKKKIVYTKRFVYILCEPITSYVKYVGITIQPSKRLASHISISKRQVRTSSKCCIWINSLLNKGLRPKMYIIDDIDISDDWEWLEKYWIDQFKIWGFELTNTNKGGKNDEPVSIYSKDGDFVKTFTSIRECERYFGLSEKILTKVLSTYKNKIINDKYQIRKGCLTDNIEKYKEIKNKMSSKSIHCIEDNLIFDSISQAAKKYNISISAISSYLKGRNKILKIGKTFKFVESS